jgi:hypothetical protein
MESKSRKNVNHRVARGKCIDLEVLDKGKNLEKGY